MDNNFTFAPIPGELATNQEAARQLRAIGFEASGTFLSAAVELVARGEKVTHENLAAELHGDPDA